MGKNRKRNIYNNMCACITELLCWIAKIRYNAVNQLYINIFFKKNQEHEFPQNSNTVKLSSINWLSQNDSKHVNHIQMKKIKLILNIFFSFSDITAVMAHLSLLRNVTGGSFIPGTDNLVNFDQHLHESTIRKFKYKFLYICALIYIYLFVFLSSVDTDKRINSVVRIVRPRSDSSGKSSVPTNQPQNLQPLFPNKSLILVKKWLRI